MKQSSFKGYDDILVVTNRLSEYDHFIALKYPYSARTVGEILLERCRLNEILMIIFSDDQDPTFTNPGSSYFNCRDSGKHFNNECSILYVT